MNGLAFKVLGIPPGTIVPEVKVSAPDEAAARKLKLELAFAHPKNWTWRIIKVAGENTMSGLQRLQGLLEASSSDPTDHRQKLVKTVPYKGFTISVFATEPTRFGILFRAENDIGEPYAEMPYFNTIEKAIAWDKKNIDDYVNEQ